ncbi:M14 family metallopeptidase [Rufibacter sp. LB8]|uniref:M14 family metallopeptidase n=1 Tax=Rufibacter sp. LB8 TaxID=2777781 RepID=UPI00178C5944|nr:M14 family metallopeptidase [Rufibacter sp. LB8]
MKTLKRALVLLGFLAAVTNQPGFAQEGGPAVVLQDSILTPKVEAVWNKYYDYASVTALCQQLAEAHPNLVKLESLGDSHQGRKMWVLTITDFSEGTAEQKPALYLDGNIHSTVYPGVENVLFTAWFLAEGHMSNLFLQNLLKEKTFYIIPTINPDLRENVLNPFAEAPRAGVIPIDDDGDGLLDEDKPEDLNKDGFISYMRRKSKDGRFVVDPQNPFRMIATPSEKTGRYEILGFEGLDNDNDGRVNEDPQSNYDPNRDWPWNWQPAHIQRGAFKYPFSLTENRNVKNFVLRASNIAAAQVYSGFGAFHPHEEDFSFAENPTQEDERVYKMLASEAQKFLAGLPYPLVFKNLQGAFGGQLNWFHGARGVYTFSTEILPGYSMVQQNAKPAVFDYEALQLLYPDEAFLDWVPFNHPTLGMVEIGGLKKDFLPDPTTHFDRTKLFQNTVLTLFHALHTPQLEIQGVETKKLANGHTEVTATVTNTRVLPTHSSQDLLFKIERPDFISLKDSTVVSGILVSIGQETFEREQKVSPARLEIPNIPGHSSVTVRWVVSAPAPTLQVEVESRKGGVVRKRF